MGKLNLVTVIILICAIVRNVMGIITAAMKYQIDKTLYNLPENYTGLLVCDIGVAVVFVLCFILILRLNKWGYYTFIATNIVYMILVAIIGGDTVKCTLLGILYMIGMSLLILLKKNGINGFVSLGIKEMPVSLKDENEDFEEDDTFMSEGKLKENIVNENSYSYNKEVGELDNEKKTDDERFDKEAISFNNALGLIVKHKDFTLILLLIIILITLYYFSIK